MNFILRGIRDHFRGDASGKAGPARFGKPHQRRYHGHQSRGLIGRDVVLGAGVRVGIAICVLIDGRQRKFVSVARGWELYLYLCVVNRNYLLVKLSRSTVPSPYSLGN